MLETSKHAELMTLACKHAILQHGPAHLIFPDEVQTLPAGEQRTASGPEGRLARSADQPAGGSRSSRRWPLLERRAGGR